VTSPTSLVFVCKSCHAPIGFQVETGKWKCDYCLAEFEKEELESVEPSVPSETEAALDEYHCQQCGSQIIADVNTVADFCVYCKSSNILKSRFTGKFQPKYVIPFKITSKQAKDVYVQWISKIRFAPRIMKRTSEIETLRGLYVPYWLFDSHVAGLIQGSAENSNTHREGDYRVTRTEHFHFIRSATAQYTYVPIDGAKNLENKAMEGIEPFQYNEMKDFAPQYMSGFYAERFDVEQDKAELDMKSRVESFYEEQVLSTLHGYTSKQIEEKKIEMDHIKGYYAMFPLYILTTIWKGKNYRYLINGQTGKISGVAPTDPWLLILYGFKISVIVFFVIFLILVFTNV